MNCQNCNAYVPDDSAFCPECGAKVEVIPAAPAAAQVFCPNCGAAVAAGSAFCDNCGTQFSYEAPATAPAKTGIFEKISSKIKVPAKVLKLGLAALVLIVAVIVIISAFGGSKPDFALYSKDGDVMYSKLSGKPVEITDEAIDNSAWITKDGKKLFYLEGGKLYWVDVTKKNAEPKKLASDVTSFKITEDGSKVFFKKNGDLRWCDLKDNGEKIDSNVGSYLITDNGKTLIYSTSEDGKAELHRATVSGKKVNATKIDSAESISIENLSENGKTVIYVADGDLYTQTGKKDAEKIDTDASVVGRVYDNGSFYYTVTEEQDEENDEGEVIGTTEETSLYFYDGKKGVEVAKDYSDWSDYALDAAVLAYYNIERKETDDGVKFETTYFIAVKGKTSELKLDDVRSVSIRNDGKRVLIVADWDDEKGYGSVYEASIGSAVKDPKKLKVEDVYAAGYTSGNDTYFYTEPSKGTYTLYVNEKKIADDVSGIRYNKESKTFLYKTDESDNSYTLWKLSGSKGKKINDDVYDFQFTPDGTLLYLCDYEKGEGTLYRTTGGEGKVIDTEVSGLYNVNYFVD